MAFFWVAVILGGRNPLLVESACKMAEALGVVVFTPTSPAEPQTKMRTLPTPSEMKMLQFWVPNPEAEAAPRMTLLLPVVMQHPALLPKAILHDPVVLFIREL